MPKMSRCIATLWITDSREAIVKVGVTGGNGFIGSWVVDELRREATSQSF